jgi:hypothetical protein
MLLCGLWVLMGERLRILVERLGEGGGDCTYTQVGGDSKERISGCCCSHTSYKQSLNWVWLWFSEVLMYYIFEL